MLEALFAVMRRLGADADRYRDEAQRLSAPHGTVAVGGAHMEPLVKAVILEGYLRALRRTPKAI